jgi:hypothetical protein
MEMIERVARALCESDNQKPDAPMESLGGELSWTFYKPYALAVLQVLKGPTHNMLIEADSSHHTGYTYQAMIYAALTEAATGCFSSMIDAAGQP